MLIQKLPQRIVFRSILFLVLLFTFVTHKHSIAVHSVPHLINMTNIEANELKPPTPTGDKLRDSQWTVTVDDTVTHTGDTILDRNYSLPINNFQQCTTFNSKQTSFVVVIESFIENFDQRQLIRETWALRIVQQIGNFRLYFMVGLSNNTDVQNRIEYENMIYEDMVQINVNEGFQNLTYKSINMLYWYIKYCSQADFLFKTDDDIYLHTPNLITLFAATPKDTNSLLCHKNKSRKILRNLQDVKRFIHNITSLDSPEMIKQIQLKFQKYLIGFDIIPGRFYPEYCSGFGYSMNYKVASKLFRSSQLIPYIGIEDMFITGLSRQKANIGIDDSQHFRLKPQVHPIEAKCAFENGRVTSNELSPGEMKNVWTNVNTAGYFCKIQKNRSIRRP